MHGVKGLMIKDFLQLKSYRKTLIIYLIIFGMTSISQEIQNGFASILTVAMTLGFGMFSIASFHYDEMAKAERYILTLPITRKEYVIAKYIFVILATIIGSVIGIVASFLVHLGVSQQIPNLEDLLGAAIGGIVGIGFIEAIQIPCIFKFGAEKGRMYIFAITFLLAFLIGGMFWLIEKSGIQISLTASETVLTKALPFLLLALTGMIYFISYGISYRIFLKKELS